MNAPTDPLVSIVVPCYRGTRYLRQALDSCLRQTYRNVEVIVVDDASPDADYRIAEEVAAADSRVRVIRRQTNGGICLALNDGYAAARGEYFSRLAQDDLFGEDAIELLVRHAQAHPDAGLVYCDMQLIDSDGKFMQMMPTNPPPTALEPANRVGLCVLWPRRVYEAVGPFDPRFALCDDYEFFLRISRQYPLSRVEGVAPFYFRYHSGQASVTQERKHDIVLARVHLAHNAVMLRQKPFRAVYWKRLVTGRLRLWAALLRAAVGRQNSANKVAQ